MKQDLTTLSINSREAGLHEFTNELKSWVHKSGIRRGLLTVFCRHTSASLIIQENADPEVRDDLLAYFKSLAPEGRDLYRHAQEGLDDMPAHIRTTLTDVSLSIPVEDGQPVLGMWQGIYLFEHRSRPQSREVVLHILGE